jgi:hypothetical protein
MRMIHEPIFSTTNFILHKKTHFSRSFFLIDIAKPKKSILTIKTTFQRKNKRNKNNETTKFQSAAVKPRAPTALPNVGTLIP